MTSLYLIKLPKSNRGYKKITEACLKLNIVHFINQESLNKFPNPLFHNIAKRHFLHQSFYYVSGKINQAISQHNVIY